MTDVFISRKLQGQLMSIRDVDEASLNNKRVRWVEAYKSREKFLAEARKEGLTKRYYSKAVAEYDRNSRQVF